MFLSNFNAERSVFHERLVLFFKVLRKFCAEWMRTNTHQRSCYHRGGVKTLCSFVSSEFLRYRSLLFNKWTMSDHPVTSNVRWAKSDRRWKKEAKFQLFYQVSELKYIQTRRSKISKYMNMYSSNPTDDGTMWFYISVVYKSIIWNSLKAVFECEMRLFLLCFDPGCCPVYRPQSDLSMVWS